MNLVTDLGYKIRWNIWGVSIPLLTYCTDMYIHTNTVRGMHILIHVVSSGTVTSHTPSRMKQLNSLRNYCTLNPNIGERFFSLLLSSSVFCCAHVRVCMCVCVCVFSLYFFTYWHPSSHISSVPCSIPNQKCWWPRIQWQELSTPQQVAALAWWVFVAAEHCTTAMLIMKTSCLSERERWS